MESRSADGRDPIDRRRLAQSIGHEVSLLQEASYAFDDTAAEMLALNRTELSTMTALLFGGPASAEELSVALHLRQPIVTATLERLLLAGYAQFQAGSARNIELTEHARKWIAHIWTPLRNDGFLLLERYSTTRLTLIAGFLQQVTALQNAHTARLRRWLTHPTSRGRQSLLQGGLSPAAIQRVQVFVEANLAAPIHLRDLAARAALSPFHFARSFKQSIGTTPRAFVEHRRIERAKRLLRQTRQPIATVAIDSGFGTQSRLTTVFKRHTGLTPAAYRGAHR
jgi:AraC family transcriptional regulator